MYKICVFGGTTEGRELVEFLNAQQCEVKHCCDKSRNAHIVFFVS